MLLKDPPLALTDSLWMLGANAYPLYLIKGPNEGAIIEGGTGPMGPLLREQLAAMEVGGDFVKQVIITHAHPDHVMAVPLLKEMFPAAIVLASEPAAQALASEKTMAFFGKIDEALTASLLASGAVADRHRRTTAVGPIGVDRVLREGDTVAVDELAIQVLETPGHSPCSLSFYEPQGRILMVSDATGYYLPDHHYWWPNYFADYEAYMASMRRLAALGTEVLCLSHNAAIRGAEDVAAYFRDAIAATEQYHQRILTEVRAGKPVRQLAEELGNEVFQKTQLLPLDFFQKNCGLLVKLSMRAAGIAADK